MFYGLFNTYFICQPQTVPYTAQLQFTTYMFTSCEYVRQDTRIIQIVFARNKSKINIKKLKTVLVE